MIIKTGTTLDASQAKDLIEVYGADHVCFDGGWPKELDVSDIQKSDTFSVLINYGDKVRLVLEDGQGLADICLSNLYGKCGVLIEDGILTIPQWHAEAIF